MTAQTLVNKHVSKAVVIVDKLLEASADDLDTPEANMERYAQAIGMKHAVADQFVLARFKKGVAAYIRWAHTDPEMGKMYDPADIRRLYRAKCFAQVLKILRQYESEPPFLSMVAQGYFT